MADFLEEHQQQRTEMEPVLEELEVRVEPDRV
jgi:hypothetical protein